jgi:hypothetical protein
MHSGYELRFFEIGGKGSRGNLTSAVRIVKDRLRMQSLKILLECTPTSTGQEEQKLASISSQKKSFAYLPHLNQT